MQIGFWDESLRLEKLSLLGGFSETAQWCFQLGNLPSRNHQGL